MSATAARIMRRFYRNADGHLEQLPWYRDVPDAILESVVTEHENHGRALDIGCGAGMFSVWMAEHGMRVTGIDLIPEAITMAKHHAATKSVAVEFVCADLFSFCPNEQFDLVFDSGCLHSLVGGSVASYRDKVLDCLADQGDYVLEHWGKRHRFDWRPVGPRRRSPTTITKLFAPLELVATNTADFPAPFPFGPTARGIAYRFRRTALDEHRADRQERAGVPRLTRSATRSDVGRSGSVKHD
jgi:SAM-dependent methyltransferase